MRKLLFAVALAALPVMGQASTSGYLENTVVFGDSLSDPGFFGFQFTDNLIDVLLFVLNVEQRDLGPEYDTVTRVDADDLY